MKLLKSKIILCAMICLIGCATAFAQGTKGDKDTKAKYQNIEVIKFDIKQDVEFPQDKLNVVMTDIVDELKKLKKFKQIVSDGEAKTDANEPSIRLNGTITEFDPGSRAKRYLIGFGAGKTKVVAHIKFTDGATGDVLFEKDVDGKVIMGLFGGDSKGATRGLAKEVAKVTKKKFFSGK